MKRFLDILFATILLTISTLPIILFSVIIKLTSRGPILFWSDRIGRNNVKFKMPKLRTMKIHTPNLASNLIDRPEDYVTDFGTVLRNFSLDELPQLWCVITGSMSFIGPRPGLLSQKKLLSLRIKNQIHLLVPGITGWAQVNGRDKITIEQKVNLEIFYRDNRSFMLDLKIIFLTIKKVLFKDDIIH